MVYSEYVNQVSHSQQSTENSSCSPDSTAAESSSKQGHVAVPLLGQGYCDHLSKSNICPVNLLLSDPKALLFPSVPINQSWEVDSPSNELPEAALFFHYLYWSNTRATQNGVNSVNFHQSKRGKLSCPLVLPKTSASEGFCCPLHIK